ncbi:MAG: NADH-quinone oxidoreductase subunit J, partial [Deltaproteobacteria bacterium]
MTPAVYTTTDGGALLVMAIMLPVIGMLAILALGLRHAERIAYIVLPAGLLIAVAIAASVARSGAAVTYVLANWQPPLGIALRADGLS